ncbi:MAG: hypothetical protein WDN44_08640 [Sphingomonas sp.]
MTTVDEDVLEEDEYGRSVRNYRKASDALAGCAGWIGGCVPLILLLAIPLALLADLRF